MLAAATTTFDNSIPSTFWIVYLIIFGVFGAGFAIACGVIAHKKGRDPWLYVLLGFFTGVIGLLITLFMTGVIPITKKYYTYAPPGYQQYGQYYYDQQAGQWTQPPPAAYCPSCGSPTAPGENFCRKCGGALPGPARPENSPGDPTPGPT